MSTSPAAMSKKTSGHPAWLLITLGVAALTLAVIGFLAQIETCEAYLTGHQVDAFKPEWGVLLQIPGLLFGKMTSAAEAEADFFGWVIQITYLVIIFAGVELIYHAVSRSGQLIGKVLLGIALAMTLFEWWTDYTFGSFITVGPLGHILFAVAVSFAVGGLSSIGIFLLSHGWKHA